LAVVTVQNTIKEGRFTLSQATADTKALPGGETPRKKILVVDDEESIRTLFQLILSSAGYEVLLAPDGKEAMRLAGMSRPDLVITDLVMPEKEGIETIRHLHSLYPDLKIVAMSGAFDGAFLKMAKMIGAQETLHKPISPKELLATTRRLVG
jgi:DNA-binding response OmpR family regulator